jgi:hypothetical protein
MQLFMSQIRLFKKSLAPYHHAVLEAEPFNPLCVQGLAAPAQQARTCNSSVARTAVNQVNTALVRGLKIQSSL